MARTRKQFATQKRQDEPENERDGRVDGRSPRFKAKVISRKDGAPKLRRVPTRAGGVGRNCRQEKERVILITSSAKASTQ